MSEEVPQLNRPLTAEEQAVVAGLTDAALQIIDAAILAETSDRWLKVARVVGRTADALSHRHPQISYSFYAQRLRRLVETGFLESRGNIEYMRFSEVRTRLPN